jgi:hypothetical protein
MKICEGKRIAPPDIILTVNQSDVVSIRWMGEVGKGRWERRAVAKIVVTRLSKVMTM